MDEHGRSRQRAMVESVVGLAVAYVVALVLWWGIIAAVRWAV